MEIKKKDFLYKMTKYEFICAARNSFNMNHGEKYCIEDLEYIVQNANIFLKTILKTQYLNVTFCKKYLLNDDYVVFDGDDIMISDILQYQPHIKIEDLND